MLIHPRVCSRGRSTQLKREGSALEEEELAIIKAEEEARIEEVTKKANEMLASEVNTPSPFR